MFRWLRSLFSGRAPMTESIHLDGDFVHLRSKEVELDRFGWRDVEEIQAWKRDLFTVDRIHVGVYVRGRERAIELHEEMIGYQSFVEEMQRRCTCFLADCWQRVAFPAFVPNQTVIWKNPSVSQLLA